jgi:molybdate transport system substrate-binding protein
MNELSLLCSTALGTTLTELIPEFEHRSGCVLSMSCASSQSLMRRIHDGASADVVVLTRSAIDELVQLGRAQRESVTDIAECAVALAVKAGVAKPDIRDAPAFKRAVLAADSIAYTTSGASGLHFQKVLERLGVVDPVKSKSVVTSGGYAGHEVAVGRAEMVVQMMSELKAVEGLDIVGPLPPELQSMTVFSAAIFNDSGCVDMAQALISFLSSPDAAHVIQSRGLEPRSGK